MRAILCINCHQQQLIQHSSLWSNQWCSHWGVKGGRVSPLTAKNLPKIGKKREKIRKKEDKLGKKRKNLEGSFTLSLLIDRVGYATESNVIHINMHIPKLDSHENLEISFFLSISIDISVKRAC